MGWKHSEHMALNYVKKIKGATDENGLRKATCKHALTEIVAVPVLAQRKIFLRPTDSLSTFWISVDVTPSPFT